MSDQSPNVESCGPTFGKKELIKFVICVVIYMVYGNLLIDESGSESTSGLLSKIFIENGGVYMITAALFFSSFTMTKFGFKAPHFVLLLCDTLATLFLTNIMMKLCLVQVVKLCEYIAKAAADLVGRLNAVVQVEFLQSVAAWLDTAGEYLALVVAYVLLFSVLRSLNIYPKVIALYTKVKSSFTKPTPCASMRRPLSPRPRRRHSRRRGARCNSNEFSGDSDSDYNNLFLSPISGPMLAD